MKKTAFTICAINYLSKALALFESFHAHNTEVLFQIIMVGKKINLPVPQNPMLKIVWAEDLGYADFSHYAFKYDVIEFSTFLKPLVFDIFFTEFEKVIYLDPDIMVFSSLGEIYSDLDQNSGVVTPHTMVPIDDGAKPSDIDLLRFGTYNLGFIALKNDETGRALARWWLERLCQYGFYEPQSGMAVDQNWINLAVGFFKNIKVSRDLGMNIAFWNLHERTISSSAGKWFVNGVVPIKFVHFSSFDPNNIKRIAHKQSRFEVGSRPDFEAISAEYLKYLERNNTKLNATPYCYDYFESGERISMSLRRIYANYEERFKEANPFRPDSSIYLFARQEKLLVRGDVKRANFKEIDAFKKIHRYFLILLRLALRILGPDRYYSLMRYLAYVSSYQNQKEMFKK